MDSCTQRTELNSKMMILVLMTVLELVPSVISTVSPTCPPEKWLHHVGFKFSCCDFCPPGQYMHLPCNTVNRTICKPCPRDRFTPSMNKYKGCLECTKCQDKAFVKIACSREADTKCLCKPGNFHNELHQECQECRKCGEGGVVVKECSQEQDTICEMCQLGVTFSYEGKCKDCTKCNVSEVKRRQCSLSSDTICEKATPIKNTVKSSGKMTNLVIIICTIVFVICIAGLIYCCCIRKRFGRQCHREESSLPTHCTAERATQSLIPCSESSLPSHSRCEGAAQSPMPKLEFPLIMTTSNSNVYEMNETRQIDPFPGKGTELQELQHSTCTSLAKLLDPDFPENNWRLLACQMNMSRSDIRNIETRRNKSPTFLIIEEYQSRNVRPTIEDLYAMLLSIKRMDAVAIVSKVLQSHSEEQN